MLKNNLSIFFGIFLVSMLFVPPSIPFMAPEAEAHSPQLYSTHQRWVSYGGEPVYSSDGQGWPVPFYTENENQCISLAGLSSSERRYTVLTCEQPFDVTVSMGQRLHIEKSNGGSHNMLPSATYGSPST